MDNRMNFTVGRKLALVFTILLVLLSVMGITSLTRAHQMQLKTEEITNTWLNGVEIANNINYLTEHVLALQFKIMTHPDDAKKAGYEQEALATLQKIDQEIEEYAATYADQEDQSNTEQVKTEWAEFRAIFDRAVELGKQTSLVKGFSGKDADITAIMDQSESAFNEMQTNLNKMVEINHHGAIQATQESGDVYNTSVTLNAVIIVLSLLIAVLLLLVINRVISRPIKQVSALLERVARGDLTVSALSLKQKDEIGSLVMSMNRMVAHLKSTMFKIQDASASVASSSQQLLATSEENSQATQHVAASIQQVAAGSESQLQSAVETSRAMEEMTVGIQRIAEATTEVSELSRQAAEQAAVGNQSIQSAVVKMQSINRSVSESGQDIKRLEQHSENIGEVIQMIGEIAGQTSLLALNASIETARAGEHGRGFAVVAREVKKLSEQSLQSVENIKLLITQIQSDTAKTAQTMNRSMEEVKQGLTAVTEAAGAFQGILQTSDQLSGRIHEAAVSAQEMAAGSEQVSASVTEMSNIAAQAAGSAQTVAASTEQQLAAVEEITSASQSLSDVAQGLNELAGTFKV